MNKYIISAGSNINPEKNIKKARSLLQKHFHLHAESEFIETEPQGYSDQPPFLNGAFLIKSELNKEALKSKLLDFEKECHRIRTENRDGPRTIDLDIIALNGEVCDDDYDKYWFIKKSVDQLL
jgi:2-amino-4-hydroxy-6-hydroxymethyldihydropteridine diphosphokinase